MSCVHRTCRNILYPLLAVVIGFTCLATAEMVVTRTDKVVQVNDNGRFVRTIPLFESGGAPYIALNDLARIYRARLRWYRVSNRAKLELWGNYAEFVGGEDSFNMNGSGVKMNLPALAAARNLYVPLSVLTTPEFGHFSFGTTSWDMERLTIFLTHNPGVSSPKVMALEDSSEVQLSLGPRVSYDVETKTGEFVKVRFRGGRIERDTVIALYDGCLERVALKAGGANSQLIMKLGPKAGNVITSFDPANRTLSVLIAQAAQEPQDTNKVEPVTSDTETPIEPARPRKEKYDYTVVIDPGHGGTDPGAIGPRGVKEKDINLVIAQLLARKLNTQGFRIILTRNDDAFIPLADRANIANKLHADLFISVHCNASISHKTKGFSVYFLSDKATDSGSEAVARFENSVVALEVNGSQKSNRVKELLGSMVRNVYMNESSELGGLITKSVDGKVNIENLGVRQAGFNVLRGAVMPAVLIETAFISNYREERKLADRRFQVQIVNAVSEGIGTYRERKNNLAKINGK